MFQTEIIMSTGFYKLKLELLQLNHCVSTQIPLVNRKKMYTYKYLYIYIYNKGVDRRGPLTPLLLQHPN